MFDYDFKVGRIEFGPATPLVDTIVKLPRGWTVGHLPIAPVADDGDRKARLAKLRDDEAAVAKALGDGIVRHLGGSKFELVYQLELDPSKPGYNGKRQAEPVDARTEVVHVHVFGKEHTATLNVEYATRLLVEVKATMPDDYLNVGKLTDKLSPIVEPTMLERQLWGKPYGVYVKGNHIAIVRPGIADAWKTERRGY